MSVLIQMLLKDKAFLDANTGSIVDEMLRLSANESTRVLGRSALEMLLPVLPVTSTIRHITEQLP